ncbi:hypothetical protein MIND_00568200 [Mycena indigotica]|uniref:phytol kinase n=1 Tax=Mycena indigotica TaxID=2126181 RepID=A0A8H6SQL3_9AGAR|nr:uncharacterized protein MIND_00568200 [Mycena indigotica]KAF7303398.1 hypothetical protein MIND_00568200 [Mycena indigotica]
MDSLLDIENIEQLPVDLRNTANALLAGDGSIEPIASFLHSKPTKDASLPLACVLHELLDLTLIPLTLENTQNDRSLRHAWTIICLLADTDILVWVVEEGSGLGLWIRVWPWLTFLDECRYDPSELTTRLPNYSRAALDSAFISIAARVTSQAVAFFDVIFSDDALLNLFARAWPYVYLITDPSLLSDAMELVRCVLTDTRFGDDAGWVEALLSQVDDGNAGLARLLLSHMRLSLSWLQPYDFSVAALPADAYDATELFRSAIFFLSITETVFDIDTDITPEWHNPLAMALLDGGFVGLTTTALGYISSARPATISALKELIHQTSSMLNLLFTIPPGHLSMARAVSNGLLHASLRFSACRGIPFRGEGLIETILPDARVRVDLIRALKKGYPELKRLASAPGFRQSSALASWEELDSLMVDRFELLSRYDAGEFPARKMCDNMQCALIGREAEFKRCSGCRAVNYCSAKCQQTDWREGEHKKACKSLLFLHTDEQSLDLTPVDRDFMRALMDVELQRNRPMLVDDTSALLRSHPASIPLTYFVYYSSTGTPEQTNRVTVLRDAADFAGFTRGIYSSAQQAAAAAAYKHLFRRVSASGGRLMLDLVALPHGSARGKTWLVLRRVAMPILPLLAGRGPIDGRAVDAAWPLQFH